MRSNKPPEVFKIHLMPGNHVLQKKTSLRNEPAKAMTTDVSQMVREPMKADSVNRQVQFAASVASSSESSSSSSTEKKRESGSETSHEVETKLVDHRLKSRQALKRISMVGHKSRKTQVGFRSNEAQPLFCSDIVFALMTKNLNSIADIVYNFTRETKFLNSMTQNISLSEKRSMTLRAYLAKENAIELHSEIIDKRLFLRKYKKVGKTTGLMKFEGITQVKFMESRAYELDIIMQEVRADIDVALEKYGRIIDYENTFQSGKLNEIMTFFTLVSISCLPATIVGGLFGMNVKVPFASDENESMMPFWSIVSTVFILTGSVFFYFKFVLRQNN